MSATIRRHTLLPLVALVFSGCILEKEANDNHSQANANNKHFYSQSLPLWNQAIGGEVSGESDVDIFYLRTQEPNNDLDMTLIANPVGAGDACVWATIQKCTKKGVANWANCPADRKKAVTTLWSCDWSYGAADIPASTSGNLTIGEDKLIKVAFSHMNGIPGTPPMSSSAKYALTLLSQ